MKSGGSMNNNKVACEETNTSRGGFSNYFAIYQTIKRALQVAI